MQEVHDRVTPIGRRVPVWQVDPEPKPPFHRRRPDATLEPFGCAPRLRDADADARHEDDEHQRADDFRHVSTVPIFSIA
jgi:hypothetical protein